MKYLISLTVLLSFLLLSGNEIKKEYFPSGKLKSEIFINGTDGWIKKYYESGGIFIFVPIKNKKYNGISSIYFKSGKKAFEINFLNDIEHGLQKIYFMSGRLQQYYYKKNGQPFGEGKSFYESGKIAAIWNYKGANVKGKTYFETGELFSICKYNDIALIHIKTFDKRGNPLNGNFSSFYNSGKLHIQGFFVQGIPDKIYQSYYESGNLSYKGSFKNGKPEGEHRIFIEDGKTMYVIPYKNGIIDGTVFYFHPMSNEVNEKIIYQKGKKIKDINDR